VLEAVFVLLEYPSPSKRIFIDSHSLPPLWFAASILHFHPQGGYAPSLLLPEEEQIRMINPNSLLHWVDYSGTDAGAQLLLLMWLSWHVRNTITHSTDKLSFEGSVTFLQKYWSELC
jgi:hypothetical protein